MAMLKPAPEHPYVAHGECDECEQDTLLLPDGKCGSCGATVGLQIDVRWSDKEGRYVEQIP